jgi:hypothetical protein
MRAPVKKTTTKKKTVKKAPVKKAVKKVDRHTFGLPSKDEIKEILQLPKNKEGDEKLEKMLGAFGTEFTAKERLFILFFTFPTSLVCGKVNKAGEMAGGAWHAYGSWAMQQPHIKKRIDDLMTSTSIEQLEEIFREDIEFNRQVLLCDRTSYKKDNHIFLADKDIDFDTIEDKKISELTENQRKMVSGFEYDKNGRVHYAVETRQSARQALLTYHKLLKEKRAGTDNKITETVVTLEGIRDKAAAKISIIQHNNQEAEKAGEFIETMKDLDEEA